MTTSHTSSKILTTTNNDDQVAVEDLKCTQILIESNNVFTNWKNQSTTPSSFVSQIVDITNRVVNTNYADSWGNITLTPGVTSSLDASLVSSSIVGSEFMAGELLRIKNTSNSNDGLFEVVSTASGFITVAGMSTSPSENYVKLNFNYEVVNKEDAINRSLVIDKVAVTDLIGLVTDEINTIVDAKILDFATDDLADLVNPLIDTKITTFVNTQLQGLVDPMIDAKITTFINTQLDALIDARITNWANTSLNPLIDARFLLTYPRLALVDVLDPEPITQKDLTTTPQFIFFSTFNKPLIDPDESFDNYELLTEVSMLVCTLNNSGPTLFVDLRTNLVTLTRDMRVHEDQGDPNDEYITLKFFHTWAESTPVPATSNIRVYAWSDINSALRIEYGVSAVPVQTDPPPIYVKHYILNAYDDP